MKPDFQCVRTHWIRGFMTFQMARRTRIVMLLVLLCPESCFLDVPPYRGPAPSRRSTTPSRGFGSGRDRHLSPSGRVRPIRTCRRDDVGPGAQRHGGAEAPVRAGDSAHDDAGVARCRGLARQDHHGAPRAGRSYTRVRRGARRPPTPARGCCCTNRSARRGRPAWMLRVRRGSNCCCRRPAT
jgi:hypothetical protein